MISLRNIIIVNLAVNCMSFKITVSEFNATNARNVAAERMDDSSTTLTNANTTCGYKTCLQLCCPFGESLLYGSCADDNYTSEIKLESIDENDFGSFHNDPCLFGWMSSSLFDRFAAFANGSISVSGNGEGSVFDFEHYCLYREPKSVNYSAKVCQPWIQTVYWHSACLIFAIFVLILIFIGYSIVPELDNLHGLVFRAYIATYIGCHVTLLGQHFTTESKKYSQFFSFFVFGLHYTAGCCALWLNVMSFNIWRTFRGLRQIDDNVRKRDRKKFIWYAIYAMGSPAVFYLTVLAVMAYVPFFQKFSLNKNLILWCCAVVLTCVVIINTFLYASTALKIKHHQKDTANIKNGVNKHNDVDEQWFNLHVKLFLITGVHTMMWVIWELWPITINTHLMIVLEVVQSIAIFVIFIWKDNVKKSLRKQLDDKVIRRLHNNTIGSSNSPTTTTKI